MSTVEREVANLQLQIPNKFPTVKGYTESQEAADIKTCNSIDASDRWSSKGIEDYWNETIGSHFLDLKTNLNKVDLFLTTKYAWDGVTSCNLGG